MHISQNKKEENFKGYLKLIEKETVNEDPLASEEQAKSMLTGKEVKYLKGIGYVRMTQFLVAVVLIWIY